MNEAIQQHNDGLMIGQEYGLVQQAETISSVLAAQAEAEVKARYIVAMQRPRNNERTRQILKAECERAGFASMAYYRLKNRGEGLSVRFAEAAARAMGNIDMKATVTYDDDKMRIIRTVVIDIETNAAISTDVVVSKTVERKFLKKGETAISSRLNSYNEMVYLRSATDDEVLPKQNSAISKAFRNGILRLLPGDIQDECRVRILKIWDGGKTNDPKQQIRTIVDTFGEIGVNADDLVGYLGHSIETCSPVELQNLRDLVRSIRACETTWHAETAAKEAPSEPKKDTPASVKEQIKQPKSEVKK